MAEHAEKHFLDVDDFEVARSIHRVVRGMHDGECPKCHAFVESHKMRLPRTLHDNPLSFDLACPNPECGFTITAKEQDAAIRAFGPVMERNLEVFEKWRNQL